MRRPSPRAYPPNAIALNDINAPITISTDSQLRDHGWPESADTVAVMLDGHCAFQHLPPQGIAIWWAAHGWIMDTYLMRRGSRAW
jgi:hypothetical protein